MAKNIVNITIDGYIFPFDDELLKEYADKMGDKLYDVVILKDNITDFAPTVKAAVEKYGIDGVVELTEKRIRLQLEIFD